MSSIEFLLSDASSFVFGANYLVDGVSKVCSGSRAPAGASQNAVPCDVTHVAVVRRCPLGELSMLRVSAAGHGRPRSCRHPRRHQLFDHHPSRVLHHVTASRSRSPRFRHRQRPSLCRRDHRLNPMAKARPGVATVVFDKIDVLGDTPTTEAGSSRRRWRGGRRAGTRRPRPRGEQMPGIWRSTSGTSRQMLCVLS